MQKQTMDLKENDEFISDLAVDSQSKLLLATSGDGTLTAINLRRKKLELQSELFDSEFLSLAIVKVSLLDDLCSVCKVITVWAVS